MSFAVKLEGVNPERLIELDGPAGSFFITGMGCGREPEMARFFYGDEHSQFFYCAYQTFTPGVIGSEITFHGVNASLNYYAAPALSFEAWQCAKENLVWLFNNRRLSCPEQVVRPDSLPVKAVFRFEVDRPSGMPMVRKFLK